MKLQMHYHERWTKNLTDKFLHFQVYCYFVMVHDTAKYVYGCYVSYDISSIPLLWVRCMVRFPSLAVIGYLPAANFAANEDLVSTLGSKRRQGRELASLPSRMYRKGARGRGITHPSMPTNRTMFKQFTMEYIIK